jgi:CspA family cold shock protein
LHRNPIAVAVNARDSGVMARGTVKFFKADKGYGAIASPDLRDGLDAWVHFSAIEMDGYRFLEAGDRVEFGYQAARQDSFRFVATWVRKL